MEFNTTAITPQLLIVVTHTKTVILLENVFMWLETSCVFVINVLLNVF